MLKTYFPKKFCKEFVEVAGSRQLPLIMATVKGVKPCMDDWIRASRYEAYRKICKRYGLFVKHDVISRIARHGRIPGKIIGRQRLAALPEVPTFAEAGITGFESALWFGLNAPAGTPRAIIERLNREAHRALALPEVKKILVSSSIEPIPGTAENFGAFIHGDIERWARVVKAGGISNQ